jgi:septum formation protein
MIYLASRSPRRAELLRQIGVEFLLHDIDIDESRMPAESATDYVCRMATTKAGIALEQITGERIVDQRIADEKRAGQQETCVVLAADTTIALDGDIIGKPADRDQCRCILERLSARQHLVLTAVALATAEDIAVRLTRNQVSFRSLSTQEIESYCATEEPMDKAGAYAIQGKAALFIDHLEGSYSAVMGLPLLETAELLGNADIELWPGE